jgi:NTP pyrophosphatase (non-canonical NTP hydrolase)
VASDSAERVILPSTGGWIATARCPTLWRVELGELQDLMARTYGEQDAARGVPATVAWLAEEVGELAKAARKGTRAEQLHELSDVLAWVASLANQLGIRLDDAAARYAAGCPKCGGVPCRCGSP